MPGELHCSLIIIPVSLELRLSLAVLRLATLTILIYLLLRLGNEDLAYPSGRCAVRIRTRAPSWWRGLSGSNFRFAQGVKDE